MSETQDLPKAAGKQPDASAPTTSGRDQLAYILCILLLPLLAIPLCVALGTSNFFLNHGASVWVRANDSIFSMSNRNCDVLVFGDSTAMTGINPEIVQRDTGDKTCNIAVTNAVLAVTNTLTLDHFLEKNHRPRVLLLQFSPDEFQAESHNWENSIYPEGLLELLRHGTPAQRRDLYLHHPREAVAFAGYTAGFTTFFFIKDAWFHLSHQRAAEDTVVVRNGFFTPPAPPRTACDSAPAITDRTHGAFARSVAEAYREAYSSRADRVLVNVAPIPACDPNLTKYQVQLSGVTSNSLLPLPIALFNDERHYTEEGSNQVSQLVSEQIDQLPNSAGPLLSKTSSTISTMTGAPSSLISYGDR